MPKRKLTDIQRFTSKEAPTRDPVTIINSENFVLQKSGNKSEKIVLQNPEEILKKSGKKIDKKVLENSKDISISDDKNFTENSILSPTLVTQGEDPKDFFKAEQIPAQLSNIYGGSVNELLNDLTRAKAELYKKSFFAFVQEFISEVMVENVVWNWHIKYLCEELQKVAVNVAHRRKKEYDLIINISPGSTKSVICSQLFPVWCWVLDPTISFITASHAEELSNRLANGSRDLIKSDKFKKFFPHIQLSSTQDNKGDYENKNGGYRLSTSSKSSPTGRHCLIAICDDIQNPKTANSEIERNTGNAWYSETLSTRKSNKEVSVMIVVQQRLHVNDITGYLLEKGGRYKQICIPAQLSDKVKPAELSANYVNGLFDANRLGHEVIQDLMISPGFRTFQTQFNQDPQSDELSTLKEAWFPIIAFQEYQKIIDGKSPIIEFFVDGAYTEKQKNDPSAIISCTVVDGKLYVLNTSAVRMDFPKFLRHLKSWTETNGYDGKSKINVEPKAIGQSVVQTLKLEPGINIKETQSPKAGKEERLTAISNTVMCGNVCLVQGKWNDEFISECTSSNPRHNDLRDCLVMAVETLLFKKKGSGKYCLGVASYN